MSVCLYEYEYKHIYLYMYTEKEKIKIKYAIIHKYSFCLTHACTEYQYFHSD